MFDFAVLFAALLQPAPQASPPRVTHERLGENSYRLHITVQNPDQLDSAQRLVQETISSLCGRLHPRFGRWETITPVAMPGTVEAPPTVELYQELTCEEELPTAMNEPASSVVDPDWSPSPADHAAVRLASEAFLDARDSGRFDDAYEWLSATFRANETLAEFSESSASFNRQAGRRIGRRLSAVTWYNNNLEGAPPGLYAAVDFVGDFELLHFTCGYLIWQLQKGGAWRLVTLNHAVIERADFPAATPEQLAALRGHARCRD